MLGNQSIALEGIITKSMSGRDGYTYSILSSDGSGFDVSSKEFVEQGAAVKVKGFMAERHGVLAVQAESIERLPKQHANELFAKIEEKISSGIKISGHALLVEDEITAALKPHLQQIAKKLLAAQKLNRATLLRFHGDADGISGALALTQFIKCKAFQQNSVVYSPGEGIGDMSALQYSWRPLVILLDFGSNEESIEGLRLLAAAGIEVLVIDHHPASEKIKQLLITVFNPWLVIGKDAKDVSKYTAGYLGCEIARMMIYYGHPASGDCGHQLPSSCWNSGSSAQHPVTVVTSSQVPVGTQDPASGLETQDAKLAGLARVACAGDKSKILEISPEAKQTALVLDYVATYSRYGNNLDFYRTVLEKKDLFDSILLQANEKISELAGSAKRSMKEKTINGISVYTIDLEGLIKKHMFPSRGKVTTNIFEGLPHDRPVIVIGYGPRSIIIRMNELAEQKGITAHDIIEKVRASMGSFIESGGGHKRAAAIKVKSGFGKTVAEEILRVLGA